MVKLELCGALVREGALFPFFKKTETTNRPINDGATKEHSSCDSGIMRDVSFDKRDDAYYLLVYTNHIIEKNNGNQIKLRLPIIVKAFINEKANSVCLPLLDAICCGHHRVSFLNDLLVSSNLIARSEYFQKLYSNNCDKLKKSSNEYTDGVKINADYQDQDNTFIAGSGVVGCVFFKKDDHIVVDLDLSEKYLAISDWVTDFIRMFNDSDDVRNDFVEKLDTVDFAKLYNCDLHNLNIYHSDLLACFNKFNVDSLCKLSQDFSKILNIYQKHLSQNCVNNSVDKFSLQVVNNVPLNYIHKHIGTLYNYDANRDQGSTVVTQFMPVFLNNSGQLYILLNICFKFSCTSEGLKKNFKLSFEAPIMFPIAGIECKERRNGVMFCEKIKLQPFSVGIDENFCTQDKLDFSDLKRIQNFNFIFINARNPKYMAFCGNSRINLLSQLNQLSTNVFQFKFDINGSDSSGNIRHKSFIDILRFATLSNVIHEGIKYFDIANSDDESKLSKDVLPKTTISAMFDGHMQDCVFDCGNDKLIDVSSAEQYRVDKLFFINVMRNICDFLNLWSFNVNVIDKSVPADIKKINSIFRNKKNKAIFGNFNVEYHSFFKDNAKVAENVSNDNFSILKNTLSDFMRNDSVCSAILYVNFVKNFTNYSDLVNAPVRQYVSKINRGKPSCDFMVDTASNMKIELNCCDADQSCSEAVVMIDKKSGQNLATNYMYDFCDAEDEEEMDFEEQSPGLLDVSGYDELEVGAVGNDLSSVTISNVAHGNVQSTSM